MQGLMTQSNINLEVTFRRKQNWSLKTDNLLNKVPSGLNLKTVEKGMWPFK